MSTSMETRIGALITVLAAALQVKLEDAHSASAIPVPGMITALPGAQVAFDYCDEGGMAWARLVGITPVQNTIGNRCVTEYQAVVEVAILRCAPTIEEDGTLPSGEEQLAAFMLQMFDMGLLHEVLTCTRLPESFDDLELGDYTPIGPDGGCLGGLWQAALRFS